MSKYGKRLEEEPPEYSEYPRGHIVDIEMPQPVARTGIVQMNTDIAKKYQAQRDEQWIKISKQRKKEEGCKEPSANVCCCGINAFVGFFTVYILYYAVRYSIDYDNGTNSACLVINFKVVQNSNCGNSFVNIFDVIISNENKKALYPTCYDAAEAQIDGKALNGTDQQCKIYFENKEEKVEIIVGSVHPWISDAWSVGLVLLFISLALLLLWAIIANDE